MRPDRNKPYYTAYDKRYRSVYAQGIDHWTAHPEELAAVRNALQDFIEGSTLSPAASCHVVEFGCGEGRAGEILAEMGFRYTGVDISEAALQKAKARMVRFGERARLMIGDLLDLSDIPSESFDAGLDVACLHMLVVDADRQTYLRNVRRVLKPGAPMLFCSEAHRADATNGVVASYDEWLRLSGTDVDTPEERSAWQCGKFVKIRLPRIAARARSTQQYRAEVKAAGFEVVKMETAADGMTVTFFARKL
jgi:SAM-dependent methyltransferase